MTLVHSGIEYERIMSKLNPEDWEIQSTNETYKEEGSSRLFFVDPTLVLMMEIKVPVYLHKNNHINKIMHLAYPENFLKGEIGYEELTGLIDFIAGTKRDYHMRDFYVYLRGEGNKGYISLYEWPLTENTILRGKIQFNIDSGLNEPFNVVYPGDYFLRGLRMMRKVLRFLKIQDSISLYSRKDYPCTFELKESDPSSGEEIYSIYIAPGILTPDEFMKLEYDMKRMDSREITNSNEVLQ